MTERDAIDQLAALLEGEAVDAPSELASLASLATSVRDHADLVAPTADFRQSLRAELLAAADAPPGLVERARTALAARTAQLRTQTRVAVATMTASSMLGGAGVAAAAQEALPGDALYGLKGMTEDARLLLAADAIDEARLQLEFARERLSELEATAGELDTDEAVALLAEMDAHSEAGAEALLDAATVGAADPDELRDFTSDQRVGLVKVLRDLPLLAKPVAEDSLELLRRIEVNARGIVPARPVVEDDALVPAPLEEPAARPSLPLPSSTRTEISRPGDGPAVSRTEDDDEQVVSMPAPEDGSTEQDTSGSTGDGDGSEPETFRPADELTEQEPEGGDDTDEGRDQVDAPTSGGELLAGEVDTTVGKDTSRTEGVADLLD